MNETKLLRVVGLSSASLFNKENPFDATNRRISIIIMNKKAEEDALKDGAAVNVPSESSTKQVGEAIKTP
jgi:chemotaxis protein MotB